MFPSVCTEAFLPYQNREDEGNGLLPVLPDRADCVVRVLSQRWGGAAAIFADKECTVCVSWTLIALRVGALADRLAVLFEQQIGSGTCFEGSGGLGGDGFLGLAVGHRIVFALSTEEDAHENLRAVGGHCCHGCDMGKEQDAISAGVGYVWEFLEFLACPIERTGDCCEEVAVEVIFDAHRNFFKAQGT